MERETLLCLALQLSCQARSLYCELNAVSQRALSVAQQSLPHDKCRQLYIRVLTGVSEVAGAVMDVSLMFDR
jgi:hypothetical protein